MTSGKREPILGTAEGDQVLAALGVFRLAIPVPFPQAGGPVNAYVIDDADGSLTLFDAGLGGDESVAALEQGFREAGRRVEDVRRILVSHGHIDHYGAARHVAERSGAAVQIHPADASKVVAGADRETRLLRLGQYLIRLGVPEDQLPDVFAFQRGSTRFAGRLDHVEPIEEGTRLRFRHFEAEVLHMPGHTPGLVCLHVPEHRLIFSDDHLLARVSPNPLLELGSRGEEDKFRALEAYLASARRLYALELDWILPGHNAPFRGHRETLDSLFAFYERRQARLIEILGRGPRTPYELVPEIFGRGRSAELFLMLSEILGNLEVLESARRVRRVPEAVPYRYEVA